MAAQPARWGASWRNKLQAVLVMAIAVIAENVPMGLWELSAFLAVMCLPLVVWGGLMARTAWRDQTSVAPLVPGPTPTKLSARSRNVILAAIFLVIGTPLSVLLLINARSGLGLAYLA